MAFAISGYLEKALLQHTFNQLLYSPVTAWYVGLYTTTPTNVTSGVEVNAAGYPAVRPTVTWTLPTTTVNGTTMTNSNVITFGPATANWGTIVAASISDAGTGGNNLFYGVLTTPRTVNNGDSFQIAANAITILVQ